MSTKVPFPSKNSLWTQFFHESYDNILVRHYVIGIGTSLDILFSNRLCWISGHPDIWFILYLTEYLIFGQIIYQISEHLNIRRYIRYLAGLSKSVYGMAGYPVSGLPYGRISSRFFYQIDVQIRMQIPSSHLW